MEILMKLIGLLALVFLASVAAMVPFAALMALTHTDLTFQAGAASGAVAVLAYQYLIKR